MMDVIIVNTSTTSVIVSAVSSAHVLNAKTYETKDSPKTPAYCSARISVSIVHDKVRYNNYLSYRKTRSKVIQSFEKKGITLNLKFRTQLPKKFTLK